MDDRAAVFDAARDLAQAVDHLAGTVDLARHDVDVRRTQLGQQRGAVLRARRLQLALDVGPGVFEHLAAAGVFVERDVELLQQILAALLDEPGHVLAEVLARLGREVAELAQHLVAHAVPVGHAAFALDLAQARVQVLPAVLEAQVERHVVDAGAVVVDLLHWNAEVTGQLGRGVLHAVAQADGRDARGRAVQRPGDHRHRVDVVQVDGAVRTDLLHVAQHVEHHGDGAQAAHDPADAQRVTDGLLQAVLLRDLEVGDGGGLVAADLDRVQHEAGAVERGAAVGAGGDDGRDAERARDAVRDLLGQAEAVGVDVVQRDLGPGEFRVRQQVTQQVAGEHGAAGTDERDLQAAVRGGHENGVLEKNRPGLDVTGR